MAAEPNECGVVGCDRDFKGSGEEVCGGAAAEESFVMVNGNSGGAAVGDLDPEENPDAELNVAEGVGSQGNAGGFSMEPLVVGDGVGAVGKGGEAGRSLENGHGHAAEGVVLIGNLEIDIGREKVGNGELFLMDGDKESYATDAGNGEEESAELREEKGIEEPSREEVKGELSLENGHDHAAEGVVLIGNSEINIDQEKVGNGELPLKEGNNESCVTDASKESGELLEEKGVGEPSREEVNRELTLEKVDNGQDKVGNGGLFVKDGNKESCVTDASNGECCEEGRELHEEDGVGEPSREEVTRELPLENGHAHQEQKDDDGEKLDAEAAVAESDQQVELESAVELEENQVSEILVQEIEDVVAKPNRQPELESYGKIEEEQISETIATQTDQERELQSTVADKQVLVATIAEANQEAEMESAPKVVEEQKSETLAIQQSELESVVAETQVPEATVPEANQEAELESAPEVVEEQSNLESAVAEKQVLEATVAEANLEAELESTPEVIEEHNSEIVVTETDQETEPESAVAVKEHREDPDEEASQQAQLEFDPKAEEEQKCGAVVTKTGQQREPQLYAEVEENLDVDPESAANEDDEHQSHMEFAEIDVQDESETVKAGEKQEAQTAVAEADELAEPESERTVEEQQACAAREVHIQERLDSVVLVEEKMESEITVSKANGREVFKSFVEVEERRQPDVVVKEYDEHEESKSSGEVGIEQKPEIVVSATEIIDVEEILVPKTVGEPSVQLGMVSEVRRGIQVEEGLAVSRASNDTTHEDDVCQSIDDTNKDIDVYPNDETKSESNVNDGTTTFVEKDLYMHKDDDEEPTCEKVEASDGIPTPTDEPVDPPLNGGLGTHAVKRHPVYIAKVPRFGDDEDRTKLQHAKLQLDEKTQIRDSVKVEIQEKKATFSEYLEKLEAAKTEEKAARAAVSLKRQEMDSIQSMFNKMKNASSVDEINAKIHNMEHTQQHGSITLTLEKQYIREIKHLKQLREEISANMGPQAEIQDAFERRDQIDEQFKTLKKELDSLRTTVLRAETNVKAARKKCDDEYQLLRDLKEQFRVADGHRQEAYVHMQKLRNELNEKTKFFYMYRDDQKTAANYASAGEKEGLRSHCSKQVEKFMDLWNKDEEFRLQYVKSNTNSTLRRLRSLDGRSLGPDEEPPILRSNYYVNRSSSKVPLPLVNRSIPVPVLDLEMKEQNSATVAAPEQVEQTNQPAKSRISTISREPVKAIVSNNQDVEEAEKEIKRTKEEEESTRKAEELAKKEEEVRKERAAAKLKEQLRLEQRVKAEEAVERKRRKAEKAQAKAEYKAQKEAELREKKRGKKKKKTSLTDSVNGDVEGEDGPAVDTAPPETTKEAEVADRTAARRPSRTQAVVVKQHNKIQPLPLPLRNRGRRKMQAWMWVLITSLLVLILFWAGNYVSFSHLSLPNLGL